jgi:hypothetical protein
LVLAAPSTNYITVRTKNFDDTPAALPYARSYGGKVQIVDVQFKEWSEKRLKLVTIRSAVGLAVGAALLFGRVPMRWTLFLGGSPMGWMLFGLALMLVSALDYEAGILRVMVAGLGAELSDLALALKNREQHHSPV